MKVLLVHTRYRVPGGEDSVVETEAELLLRAGVTVERAEWDNRELDDRTVYGRIGAGLNTIWNPGAAARMSRLLRTFRPDVIHVHNIFPSASPAIYFPARVTNVPVVQTLHNYRLQCLNGMHLRAGGPCEACVGLLPWRGVVHSCYRNNRAASFAVMAMIATHRMLKTWHRGIRVFIAPTKFARDLLVRGGLPPERFVVKPQVLRRDIGNGRHDGRFGLYVGRLSAEKGAWVAIEAWRKAATGLPLIVVGQGPDRERLLRIAGGDLGVRFTGELPQEEVWSLMQRATLLLVPSLVYEVAPMVIIEAFAVGLPFIVSDLGALTELARDSGAGWLAPPSDTESWGRIIRLALADGCDLARKGLNGRQTFEMYHAPDQGAERLLQIYERAMTSTTRGNSSIN